MKPTFSIFLVLSIVMSFSCSPAKQVEPENVNLLRADSLLQNILSLYKVEKYGLLQETYPLNPNQEIGYAISNEGEVKKQQEVAFLWPYSGLLSGCVALYKITGEEKYKELLDNQIIPGIETYWDTSRDPACYQSYPVFAGENDRYYDDNDWIAIDFCDYYELTKEKKYLNKAIELHKFIYSGWNEELGGGIFWCEQLRTSKNTCSNAPATVLCMKLYELTTDVNYLDWAKKTYHWTKEQLCDPADYVYWDNVDLQGNIVKDKYTYNSGQMIQAAVLLYEATKDKSYLEDAQKTAGGTYDYFVRTAQTHQGEQLFYPASPWFNVILYRGLKALAEVDGNTTYVDRMAENAGYAWKYARDENGLLGNQWSAKSENKFKWLLDNACMVELYAEISNLKPTKQN